MRNISGILAHAKDYLAHQRTQKQYGPLGSSWYTEKGKDANVIHIR